jgi:hypothetical protein
MASQMRVYVLLGAVLVAAVWLEKTASAQNMEDVYTYCDSGYWNGSIWGDCVGYDNTWGCFHDDYTISGYLFSPTRSAPIWGSGWNGGASLPWQHEAGS